MTRRERDAKRLQRKNNRLQRQVDRLKQQVEGLKRQLDEARRAGRRQAAPFAKDRPQGRGGHPGTAGRCGVWPPRLPPAPGAGRRDPRGAGPGGVSGLRRRGRSDPRGVAVSGRAARGAPGGAALRHRGRPLLAVSAASAGPPRAADFQRAGRGGRAARSRGRRAGRRAAHGDGGAAGEGGPPAADHVRAAGHAGRPRPGAAPGGPRRRAGLHGAVRAGPQRTRGHAGRDRLARRRRAPLAVGIHHPGHDRLRDLPRPRIRRCRHGAGDRLRRRARARRVGAVSLLRRTAPDMSESFAPTLQAPPGGSSRQSLGRRGAGGPAGRPRPAGPLQRGSS